ncbi:uncharacterized protein PV06_08185 [Exophiala oligosperma]|uniref:Uncharacterized protein n=1 Tax=Exophiala oligosperma TaxID=215243 RepID=A0A0D2DVR6_9EURO|nr:uncharacterized protein PV06_08185 [Exophiala oligosperma]KIW39584.1 hypothetical protein PV06_08185 [Exophiala oligosperma]
MTYAHLSTGIRNANGFGIRYNERHSVGHRKDMSTPGSRYSPEAAIEQTLEVLGSQLWQHMDDAVPLMAIGPDSNPGVMPTADCRR